MSLPMDGEHPDPERQQVRKALNVLVAFDKQRGNMDPALEAIAEAFKAVCVAEHNTASYTRQPCVLRMGDEGLPAKPLAARRQGGLPAARCG